MAQVDLMTTPTKERLAATLAQAIYEQIASPLSACGRRRWRPFRGLRISPTMTIDPEDGSLSLQLRRGAGRRTSTPPSSGSCELPGRARRASASRTVALVLDEFQEVVEIDPDLPKLMRAVFQRAAGGRARLPRQQAAHHGADLQRRERAVLAQRQARSSWARSTPSRFAPSSSSASTPPARRVAAGGRRRRARRSPAAIPTRPRSSVTSSGSRLRTGRSPIPIRLARALEAVPAL